MDINPKPQTLIPQLQAMDPVTAKKVVFTTREKGEGGDFAAQGFSPELVIERESSFLTTYWSESTLSS